jgi:hypothetical protein
MLRYKNYYINIRSLAKLKQIATEMYQLLSEIYGEDILPRACVSEWYKKFLERREEVEDDQKRVVQTNRTR